MVSSWDRFLKRMIDVHPQDMLSWLLPGARLDHILSPHLHNRNINADLLFQVLLDDKPALFHLEIQTRGDPTMAKRLWEYNVLATCQYDLPVYSFVLYLTKDRSVAVSPYLWVLPTGQEVHRFSFQVIKLWELSVEVITQQGLLGLFPLIPLMRGGTERMVVEEMITTLVEEGEQPKGELLSIAYAIASLVFEDTDNQAWLRKRFAMLHDILHESWAFQEIMQEGREEGIQQGRQQGREEGIQQGRQEGIQQGELHGLRETFVEIILERFPALVHLTRTVGNAIHDTAVLRRLIVKISGMATAEEVEQCLRASDRFL